MPESHATVAQMSTRPESTGEEAGRTVDVEGVPTYFEVHGEGPPLLLLHGGLCSDETWSGILGDLAAHYRVTAPERRGHGRTPDVDQPITIDSMLAETVAFMDAIELQAAGVVGFSDGANIGFVMAARHPDRVGRLVAISGNSEPDGLHPDDDMPARAHIPELFAGLAETYARLSPDGREHLPVIWEKLEKNFKEGRISRDELASITRPTLVMAADADVIKLDHTISLFAAIPEAQLAIVPNCGHGLLGERPELVARLILDFLKG